MSIWKNIFAKAPGTTQTEETSIVMPFKKLGTVDGLVQKTKGDKVIWAIVILLTMASLLLVYSSTGSLAFRMSKSNESYLFKQSATKVIYSNSSPSSFLD